MYLTGGAHEVVTAPERLAERQAGHVRVGRIYAGFMQDIRRQDIGGLLLRTDIRSARYPGVYESGDNVHRYYLLDINMDSPKLRQDLLALLSRQQRPGVAVIGYQPTPGPQRPNWP